VEEKFAIALSEKFGEEGVREVSLKIKYVFPKFIKHLFVFFTPHYKPIEVLKGINLALKPMVLVGIETPLLIFEERIIERGIAACCINKKEAQLKEIFIKKEEPQDIEAILRLSLRDFVGEKQFLLSFLSSQTSPIKYLRGVELSLGKFFNVYGAGYLKRFSSKNYQIINETLDRGAINAVMGGLQMHTLKIEGFLPLGRPFTLTRVSSKKDIIMEINNQPAINIYKNYLEEKFDVFKKNHLFPLYPLGIKEGKGTHLVNVVDYLEDGSLICIGEIKENSKAHIMLIHPTSLFEYIKQKIEVLKTKEDSLLFMINTLIRKKILKEHAEEEIALIKQRLGNKFKTIGIYSDYCLFFDKEMGKTNIESSSLSIMALR
jgi:hypothetical protein